MKGEELGKLLLDGLLVDEDGRLVAHDYAHVDPECIHILVDGDLMLLGLIPVHIKSGSEVLYLVLQCNGRTDKGPHLPEMVVVVGVGWMTARPLPRHL